jgi:hypothetical protein
MLDSTPVTIEITKLITAGTTEQALLARVVRQFPEITPAELWAALQDATATAERKATTRQ